MIGVVCCRDKANLYRVPYEATINLSISSILQIFKEAELTQMLSTFPTYCFMEYL